MKSPTIFTDNRGFTLIEILVVLGIIAMVAAAGLFFDLDNFRGYSFRSDRDILVSALEHARSEAITNICEGTCTDGKPHGVKIFQDKFVVFQGEDYAHRDTDYDTEFETNKNTQHYGVTEVVFAQLSGNATSPETSPDCASLPEPICMIITDDVYRNSKITVNSEGQILWTN